MKFKVEASTAQTKGKLSKQAIDKNDKNDKNVDKDGKTEKKDEGKDKRVKTWHRVGWNMHMESKKAPGQIIPSPFSISETLNKPSHYSGPVYLRAHSHTYNSSKNVQHTHRTTLVHSFCPGIRGAPPAEPNTHFYTELDDQLKRIRKTCSEIRDKNVAIVQGHGNQFQDDDNGYAVQFPNYEDPPLDPSLSSHTTYNRYQYKDTVELRRRVNESYEDQLLFFTHCVAINSNLQASGTCASAAAAAAAAIAAADTPRLRRSTVFRSEESQKVREKLQQQQKKRSWNAPSASWRPLSQEELLIEAARTEVENAISLQHLLALEEETKRQASIGKKLYDGPKIRIRSFRVGGGTGGGGGEKVGGTNGEEVEELTTLEVVNMPYLPDWLVPKESRLTAAAIASSNGNLLDPKRPNPSGAFLTNSVSKGPENTAVPPEIVRRRQLRGAPLVKAGQANSTTSLKTEEVPEPEKKVKPGWSPLGLPETRSVVSVKNPSDSGSECGFQGSLQQEPMSYGMMALVVNLYESLKGSLPPQRPTCAGDLLTSHSVNNAPCFHRASSQAKLD